MPILLAARSRHLRPGGAGAPVLPRSHQRGRERCSRLRFGALSSRQSTTTHTSDQPLLDVSLIYTCDGDARLFKSSSLMEL